MKKFLAFISLTLVLSLSLAACSSDDKKDDSKKSSSSSKTESTKKSSTKDSSNPIVKALQASEKQESVQISGTENFDGVIAGASIKGDITFEAQQSFKSGNSSFTMDLTPIFASLGGGGVEPTAQYVIETRIIDGYIYTKAPSIFGSESKWKKEKADDASVTASSDPTSFIQFLYGAGSDFKNAGKEDVEGVSTTKYTVTLDPDEFKKQIKKNLGDDAEETIKAVEKLFSKPITAQVWIGKDNLLRKVQLGYELDAGAFIGESAQTEGGTIKLDVTLLFKNYGEPVSVEVPDGV